MRNYIILFTLLLVGFAPSAQAAINVFACEPEWAALSEEIGGDNVSVTSATNAMQDPHHIRAKPSLLSAMRQADLLICTGAGLESGWLPVLLTQAGGARVQRGAPGHIMIASHLHLLDVPTAVDRAMGDVHPEGNPHVQLDPRNILVAAKVIADSMKAADPEHASAYDNNLLRFSKDWAASMQNWQQKAAHLRGVSVVLYHDNWTYMLHWLGMKETATLETKPGVPPSPAHLEDVLQAASKDKSALILLTPFEDDQAANWLAEKTGAHIVRLPFTVGGDDTKTLTDMFDRTITLLTENAP